MGNVRGAVTIKVGLDNSALGKDGAATRRGIEKIGKSLKEVMAGYAEAAQKAQAQASQQAGKHLAGLKEKKQALEELERAEREKTDGVGTSQEQLQARLDGLVAEYERLGAASAKAYEAIEKKAAALAAEQGRGGDTRWIDAQTEKLAGEDTAYVQLAKTVDSYAGSVESCRAALERMQGAQNGEGQSPAVQAARAEVERLEGEYLQAMGEMQRAGSVMEVTLGELEQALARAAQRTAEMNLPGPTEGMEAQAAALLEYGNQIEALKNEIAELEAVAAESGEAAAQGYRDAAAEIQRLEEWQRQLSRAMLEMRDVAGTQVRAERPDMGGAEQQGAVNAYLQGQERYRELAAQMRETQGALGALAQEQQRYNALASEQSTGAQAAVLHEKKLALGELQQKYTGLAGAAQASGHAVENAAGGMGSSFDLVRRAATGLAGGAMEKLRFAAEGLGRAGAAAGGAVAAMVPRLKQMGKASGDATKKTGGLAKAVLKLRTILSAMVIRKAINAAISAMKEGVQSLAKYSGEVNAALSGLKTETTYLKNNLAAAFAPIITAVVPMLATLVGWINSAVSALGQLIAALGGRGTYTKAVKQQQDYAGAVSDSAGAVKELDKAANQLSIDELNTFSENDASTGGGGGGGDAAAAFEEAEVAQNILELVERIREVLGRIWAPVKDAWNDYGQGVIDAWKRGLKEVGLAAAEVGKTVLAVWEDGWGYEITKNVLLVLEQMGLWLESIASAWRGAWDNKGYDLVESFARRLNEMLLTILAIGESFRTAWDAGAGQEILEHIFGIITNINNIAANLSGQFRLAWESVGLGDAIAANLLGIFSGILDIVEWIAGAIAQWAANLDFEPFLQAILGLLENVWPLVDSLKDLIMLLWETVLEPLATWLVESAFPLLLDAIGGLIKAVRGIIDFIVGVFTGDWERAWSGIQTFFAGIVDALTALIQFAMEFFVQKVQIAWDLIMGVLGAVFGWVKAKVIDPVVDAFEAAGGGIKGVFAGVGEFIKGIINGIIGFINGMLAAIAGGINAVINALNTLSIDIPDWVPGFGGKKFGFDIPNVTAPQIPMLAKGAVIPPNKSFMAVLGDQRHGNNIEAPEDLIRKIVREEAGSGGIGIDALRALLRELGLTGDAFNVAIEMDGRELTRGVRRNDEKMGRGYGGAFAYVR